MDSRKCVRILVAESHSVSQMVAMKHLEKAGYAVDLADNGQRAIETVRTKTFALVLMDLQLPVVDGYGAARAIRTIEKETSIAAIGNHLPIIAMVDDAIERHMAECYTAGMDDCIAKPLRKDNLLAMIEKWIPRGLIQDVLPSCDTVTPKKTGPDKPCDSLVFDMERALNDFDGNWEFLRGIFAEFFKQIHQQMTIISEAVDRKDAETVRTQAHSIKGGAANLTVDQLAKLACDLETRGKAGELDGAGEIIQRMENMIQQLKNCVEEFRYI